MTQPLEGLLIDAAGYVPPPSYAWTRDVCRQPLGSADVAAISTRVLIGLEESKVILPDRDNLVRRCVVALLSGHLVLQGPPGTGKTTLCRLLAEAFRADLRIATATADWSTYDVVGGLRPAGGHSLVGGLGCVSEAALHCAEAVREGQENRQAVWLLMDELNRADIDKAIGPLYTVLSSVAPDHLDETPLDLWFGEGEAAQLWMPARFRIIGTMNDVDTSFVNALSQGLARRFQFLYIGVPDAERTAQEVDAALLQARTWVAEQYPELSQAAEDELIGATEPARARLVAVLDALRRPAGLAGWPLGTAQVVDVWRTVLLQAPSEDVAVPETVPPLLGLLDEAFADRVVPQMSTLDRHQLDAYRQIFEAGPTFMPASARAVEHLANPHAPL